MTSYIGVIHKHPGSIFGVSFPDFPGCISAADDLSDVPAAAKEALELCVEGMIEDGDRLPEPRSLTDIQADGAWNDYQAILVIDVALPARQVRANISIDEALLIKIDRVAEDSGMTRSGFLAVAARQLIAKRKGKKGKRRAA